MLLFVAFAIIGFFFFITLNIILNYLVKKNNKKPVKEKESTTDSSPFFRIRRTLTWALFIIFSAIYPIISLEANIYFEKTWYGPIISAVLLPVLWLSLKATSVWFKQEGDPKHLMNVEEMHFCYIISSVISLIIAYGTFKDREIELHVLGIVVAIFISSYIPINKFFSKEKIEIKKSLNNIFESACRVDKKSLFSGIFLTGIILVISFLSQNNSIVERVGIIVSQAFSGAGIGMLIYIDFYTAYLKYIKSGNTKPDFNNKRKAN